MVLKHGHFGEQIRNMVKFLNTVLDRAGEISWTNHMKNEAVLHGVKKERNILHTIKWRLTGLVILHRNSLLKHVIEVNIKGRTGGTERWGIICKQLLDDLKGKEKMLEFEIEHTRLHCLENVLWKRLWTCCKTGYAMK